MFTGIVEEIGTVREIRGGGDSSALKIEGKRIFEDLCVGDSVAVSGVCLTVTSLSVNAFTADVMHETLRRSSLGGLRAGSRVNLERAMPANGRFGGHIVTGHIDGAGVIAGIKKDGIAVWYTIKAGNQILKYVVEKGSVAIDGISLTVASVSDASFQVSIIPHTIEATALHDKSIGDSVNLEADLLGKYVERLIGGAAPQSNVTREFLTKHGI